MAQQGCWGYRCMPSPVAFFYMDSEVQAFGHLAYM
ncbi:rCG35035, partial [Rattus norvegicus]